MSELESPCLEWTGSKNSKGYGKRWDGARLQYVHRLTWAESNGPIPDGMVVCHRCDNPSCYRLEHLFIGTQSDNIHDMHRKGRHPGNGLAQKTHCKHGHPLSGENVYWRPSGGRLCRTCNAASTRRSYERAKARRES